MGHVYWLHWTRFKHEYAREVKDQGLTIGCSRADQLGARASKAPIGQHN